MDLVFDGPILVYKQKRFASAQQEKTLQTEEKGDFEG